MADYIGISKPLAIAGVTPKPEINYFYGPWESINEALNNIPQLARIKGLTVGIIEGSEIVEYWFKNGVDLVLKLVDPESVYTTNEIQQIINGLGNTYVQKETGKELIPTTALSKLNQLPTKENNDNTYVAKEEGKSLIEDTKIAKLDSLPSSVFSQVETQQEINIAIDAVNTNLQEQIDTHESQIQNIVTAYIDNKGYFATLTSLQASYPTPEIGDTAYVADALSSTGYYIYNVVDGIWTSSTVEAPPVTVPIGDYILKTNVKQELGDSETDVMSQKAVTDELVLKADKSELVQLAGEVTQWASIDLLKNTTIIHNRYLTLAGTDSGFINHDATDYIAVEEGDEIIYSGYVATNRACIVTYDSDKIMISTPVVGGEYKENIKVTIGSGIAYIRASSTDELHETTPATFVLSRVLTAKEIEDDLIQLADEVSKITLLDISGDLLTGAIMSNGTFNINVTTSESTDYIFAREGDVLLYSGATGSGTCNVAAYDIDKNFVGALIANANTVYEEQQFTIPSDGYIRASSRKVGALENTTQLKVGVFDENQPSNTYVKLSDVDERVFDVDERVFNIENGSIYNHTDLIDGKYIRESGIIANISTCEITNFIDVVEGDEFIYSAEIGTQVIPVAGYDENEQYIQTIVNRDDLLYVDGSTSLANNYLFEIPSGISKIVAMSRNAAGSVSGITLSVSQIVKNKTLKKELESLKKYIDSIGYKPSVVVEPVATNNTSLRYYRSFNVYSLIPNLNEYAKHSFVECWNRTTNADRGWYCPSITFRDKKITHGEYNWIHMLDSSVAGFENETGHVGVTHGCELFEREVFMLDGKVFVPGDESFTILHGDCFTMLTQSTIYAGDRISATNGDNNVFKLDGYGNPIESTKHWMHVKIEGNNKMYLRNKLQILRDNTRFSQCHIGMLSCVPSYFQYEQIKNTNWDVAYYPFDESDTERQPAQAVAPSDIPLGTSSLQYPLSNESIKWGSHSGINYQMKCKIKMLDSSWNGKENHIFMRSLTTNKTYMQPVLTTAFPEPDVFMAGDILEGEVFTELNISE